MIVSCYPHGKVPGSDINVHSESVTFLDKLKSNLSITCFYYTLSNSYVRTVHNIVLKEKFREGVWQKPGLLF